MHFTYTGIRIVSLFTDLYVYINAKNLKIMDEEEKVCTTKNWKKLNEWWFVDSITSLRLNSINESVGRKIFT